VTGRRARASSWLPILLTTVTWAWYQRVEPYLGHDESVYAARARSWVTGEPAAGWEVYRPIGLPALGRVMLAVGEPVLGGATTAFRVLGLVLTLAPG
jgi:hypothetical protein